MLPDADGDDDVSSTADALATVPGGVIVEESLYVHKQMDLLMYTGDVGTTLGNAEALGWRRMMAAARLGCRQRHCLRDT